MADDRLFHKKLGHSEKVNLLSDIEDIAWHTYILAADDFGVMLFSAFELQRARERLAKKPTRAVQKMLERIRDVGLIRIFEHQNRTYCYQHNWQDYQKVRYAMPTSHPRIPDALLRDCTRPTQWLMTIYPGGGGRENKLSNWKPEREWAYPFRNGSVPVPTQRARSHAVEGAWERARGETEELDAVSAVTLPERAGAFCEWYAETHERLFDVGYIGNPHKDYQSALQLVAKFSDQDVRDAALFWFGQEDNFAMNGTRTITKFASRASDCLLQAKRELAKVGA